MSYSPDLSSSFGCRPLERLGGAVHALFVKLIATKTLWPSLARTKKSSCVCEHVHVSCDQIIMTFVGHIYGMLFVRTITDVYT
jgi:hypothetical protein